MNRRLQYRSTLQQIQCVRMALAVRLAALHGPDLVVLGLAPAGGKAHELQLLRIATHELHLKVLHNALGDLWGILRPELI